MCGARRHSWTLDFGQISIYPPYVEVIYTFYFYMTQVSPHKHECCEGQYYLRLELLLRFKTKFYLKKTNFNAFSVISTDSKFISFDSRIPEALCTWWRPSRTPDLQDTPRPALHWRLQRWTGARAVPISPRGKCALWLQLRGERRLYASKLCWEKWTQPEVCA